MSNIVVINRNGNLRVATINKQGHRILHLDVADMRSKTSKRLLREDGTSNFVEVSVLIERDALDRLLTSDDEVDVA